MGAIFCLFVAKSYEMLWFYFIIVIHGGDDFVALQCVGEGVKCGKAGRGASGEAASLALSGGMPQGVWSPGFLIFLSLPPSPTTTAI